MVWLYFYVKASGSSKDQQQGLLISLCDSVWSINRSQNGLFISLCDSIRPKKRSEHILITSSSGEEIISTKPIVNSKNKYMASFMPYIYFGDKYYFVVKTVKHHVENML